MKIQNKLFITFGVLLSLLVFLSVFSGIEIYNVDKEFNELIISSIAQQSSMSQAIAEMRKIYFMNLTKGYLITIDANEKEFLILLGNYNKSIISLTFHLNNFSNNINNDKYLTYPEKQERLKILDEALYLFNNTYRTKIEELDDKNQTSKQELYLKIGEIIQIGEQISGKLETLYDMVAANAEDQSAETTANSQRTMIMLLIMAAFLIVLSFFVSLVMTSNIRRPILKMMNSMLEISKGNLSFPIHSKYHDELGMLANQIGDMVDSISEMNKVMTVMANLDSMVYTIDLDYKLIYINESAANTFRLDINNYKGKTCYKVLRNYDKPCLFCHLSKFLPDKDSFPSLDYEFIYDDILNEWIGGKAAVIRWVDGSMAYLQSVKIETEKKKHQEQLSEALKAAQAASDAKSTFLANMSHEIRTPMNAVLGMAELLLQENLNERQSHYADDIKIAANSLLNIINDILDASKLQVGKLQLISVHYDFTAFIRNIDSITQFLVKEKNKNLLFELIMNESDAVYLYGDDVRLRQVLLNLLSNAIKFTERGYVRLSIFFTDTTIQFIVSDSGIGIPKESIPKLFDAFEQVDVMQNRTTTGTGLGLTITKALVEMMGGNITVESDYGHGSTFCVEIPKVSGNAELIKHIDDKQITLSAPNAKVLVVDDNETNLNVACGLLQLFQIKAETATSGSEAIKLVKQNKYDIVFMDHRMPEMSGIETTKVIHELGINIPIIALTASAVAGTKETMIKSGMNDYLWKPIIKTELVRVLKEWLPAEKILEPEPVLETLDSNDTENITDKNKNEFLRKIEHIKGLDRSIGINHVDGQHDVYEKTLKLMIKEIEKSDKNLKKFLASNDMHNFCIEVHSMKGSLANIGAMELSAEALALENASNKIDTSFCTANLPSFLERLNDLNEKLKDVFSIIHKSSDLPDAPVKIMPEMLQILERLNKAIEKADFVRIDNEMINLNELNINNVLKEKIENISDAVMIMDYDTAAQIIRNLSENK